VELDYLELIHRGIKVVHVPLWTIYLICLIKIGIKVQQAVQGLEVLREGQWEHSHVLRVNVLVFLIKVL
jgi:hypothetical protein